MQPVGRTMQDVVFVLDITQSFSITRVRRIIRAIQLMVGALDNNTANLTVAVVNYPYKTNSLPYKKSSFIVRLGASCIQAAETLDELSVYLDRYQSENTYAARALEFLSKNINTEKLTSVITIMSGISNGFEEDKDSTDYPPNAIKAAMSMNRFKDAEQVKFFVVGDMTKVREDKRDDFEKELDALSNDIPENRMAISNRDDRGFINQTLSFLQEGNILCKKQGTYLLGGGTTGAMGALAFFYSNRGMHCPRTFLSWPQENY